MNLKFFILWIAALFFLGAYSCSSSPKNEDEDTQSIATDTIAPPLDDLDVFLPPFDSTNYEWADGYILLDWQTLSRVIFEDGLVNDTLAMIPVFHDDIKILEGKPVQINGYNIVFGEKTGKLHLLSAYPMSQCFFCGAAGPETVMDVKTKKAHHDLKKMDKMLTFRGFLKLNVTDLDFMNYILEDAELVKK